MEGDATVLNVRNISEDERVSSKILILMGSFDCCYFRRVIPNGGVGSGMGKNSWVEYGAIDDSIIEKLKDDEDVRVRLQGNKKRKYGKVKKQFQTFLAFIFTIRLIRRRGVESRSPRNERHPPTSSPNETLPQLPRFHARRAQLQDEPARFGNLRHSHRQIEGKVPKISSKYSYIV